MGVHYHCMGKRGTGSREEEILPSKKRKEDSSSEDITDDEESEDLISPTPYIEQLCGKLSVDDETEYTALNELFIPFLDAEVGITFQIPDGEGTTPDKLEKYFKDCEPAFKKMLALKE